MHTLFMCKRICQMNTAMERVEKLSCKIKNLTILVFIAFHHGMRLAVMPAHEQSGF